MWALRRMPYHSAQHESDTRRHEASEARWWWSRSVLPGGPIAALMALTVVIVACSGEGNVFSLKAGDCFNQGDAAEVENVELVDCDELHQYEVFAAADVEAPSGARFPGSDQLEFVAFSLCLGHFDEYVGETYENSLLDIQTLSPSRDSWEDAGDREVVCTLFDLEDLYMEGSMKGSRR